MVSLQTIFVQHRHLAFGSSSSTWALVWKSPNRIGAVMYYLHLPVYKYFCGSCFPKVKSIWPTLETDILVHSVFPNHWLPSTQSNFPNPVVPKVPKLVWVLAQTATDKVIKYSCYSHLGINGFHDRPIGSDLRWIPTWSMPLSFPSWKLPRLYLSEDHLCQHVGWDAMRPCLKWAQESQHGGAMPSSEALEFGDSSWCMFCVYENAFFIQYVILLPQKKWTRKSKDIY